MRPVTGVRVTVTDARDPASEEIIRTTDEKGRIILLSNLFIADEHRNLLLKVDVDGEARGYRSFGVEECRIKMGQSFKGTLVPLDDRPYVYSASFHGYDIMWQDFEMLYSDLNDYDFEIRVTTRNPGGEGLTPAPRFGYWKKDGGDWNYSKHIDEATARDGNTYVFKGPWKRRISPWISKDQYPFFTLDARDDSAARQGLPEG